MTTHMASRTTSQLIYRGCAYSIQAAATPLVKQEVQYVGKYRGVNVSLKQYDFETTKLENSSWRTMRFLGKAYLVKPNFVFGAAL